MRSPAFALIDLNAFISRLLKASKVLKVMEKEEEHDKEYTSVRNKNTTDIYLNFFIVKFGKKRENTNKDKGRRLTRFSLILFS